MVFCQRRFTLSFCHYRPIDAHTYGALLAFS